MSKILFIAFFIFTNGLPSKTESINWNGHWASQCDFEGNDLSNKPSTSEDCGGLCDAIDRCTHFAWTTHNGGTCWLKKGHVTKDEAQFTGDWDTLCGFSAGNTSPDFSGTDGFSFSFDPHNPNGPWMNAIRGSIPIGSISIPGTHGSGNTLNRNSLGYARTQFLSISDQLSSGIRYLDIRCRHLDNAFTIHHGQVYMDLNFDNVLITVTSFLQQNPSETILMRVKEEYDADKNTRSFHETFNEYFTKYSRFFWKFNNNINPSLDELRGKIMIIQGFDGPIKYGPLFSEFNVQDNYSPSGGTRGRRFSNKFGSILENFDRAQNSGATMFINHLSAFSKAFFIPITPLGFAERMNNDMKKLISERRPKYMGIIAADFPDSDLISAIVMTNF